MNIQFPESARPLRSMTPSTRQVILLLARNYQELPMATAALSTTVRKGWFLDELLQSVHILHALDLPQSILHGEFPGHCVIVWLLVAFLTHMSKIARMLYRSLSDLFLWHGIRMYPITSCEVWWQCASKRFEGSRFL